nr:MAG TPA_asm: hypothetical protein [Caudoviricetes sp.]
MVLFSILMLLTLKYTIKHKESLKIEIRALQRTKENTRLLFCRVLALRLIKQIYFY